MKTNLDKHFKTDKTLEKEGVDFAIDDKTSFKLRRFNADNPRTKAAMAAYYKPYARQIEMGTMPPEKTNEISIRLFIDICLVSWQGIEDESGKPIECNKENALELFKDLPDLFSTLWAHVNNFENYKEELGNS
jgi:hypothetical protein